MCRFCSSQKLILYNNQIGDAGVMALANAFADGAMAHLQESFTRRRLDRHALKYDMRTGLV